MFYPKAFTGTCTGELGALRDDKAHFDTDDTIVLAVSTDTDATLKAFAAAEGLEFQLLSDWWPHGAVAQAYGVFLPERGFATRGTFVIDKAGVLRWSVVNAPGDARSTADYQAALAALEHPSGPGGRAMGCLLCSRRQADPQRGPSPWRRGVVVSPERAGPAGARVPRLPGGARGGRTCSPAAPRAGPSR